MKELEKILERNEYDKQYRNKTFISDKEINEICHLIFLNKKLEEEKKTKLEHINFWHNSFNEAIDNIHRLEEENKELSTIKSMIQALENNNVSEETYYVIGKEGFLKGDYKHLLDEYIPKQAIRDKIEELKKEIEEKNEHGTDFTLIHEHEIDTNGIIAVLEELLEERNK